MSIVSKPKTIIGTFLPTQISECQLWLDAADTSTTSMTRTGNTVSVWKDKSGNGNATTSANGSPQIVSSAINSQTAMSFNVGTNFYMDPINNPPSTPYLSFFIVATLVSANSYGRLVSFGLLSDGTANNDFSTVPNFIICEFSTSEIVGVYRNNTTVSTNVTFGTPFLISVLWDGTNLNFLYNGGTYTSVVANTGSFSFNRLGLGVNINSKSNPNDMFIGYIGEIVMYYSYLNQTQRQSVEGYLAQKWGLTSQLPAGHPGLRDTFYGTGISRVVVPFSLVPYYPAYKPLTATGSTCILWLDASDPTTLFSDATGTTPATAGGTVGYWRDKSASGFNATQTTLSYRPTYITSGRNGNSILSFNGLTNFLNLPQFTAVPLTIFFVAQGTVFLGNTFFLSLGSSGNTVMMRMLPGQMVYGVDGITTIQTTNADTNWHLWTLTISSSTATFYFDGTLVGTSSWSNGSAYTFATNTIASWNQQVGSKATTLNIPEILFYNTVLGTTQQQQVESYLASKWSTASQLSQGHINFSQPAGLPYGVFQASIRNVAKYISVNATGGTITYVNISGIDYRIHTFSAVGTANFTLTSPASVITTVLVVAGGGAGGYDDGGGGGAGGVIYNASFTITSGSYTVTVGNGGTSNGASGANSILSSLTAIGGGGGANGNGNGTNGGSGGGLGWGVGNGSVPGSGTAGQGFAGGGGTTAPNYAVGGGGGAGGVGGTGSGITPGNGGIGVSYTIAGTTYNVGGGGGGGLAVQNTDGTNSTASFGGGNGAGRGANAAVAGTPNTGGGGGGANNMQATNGAFGGSGIVIISYRWK